MSTLEIHSRLEEAIDLARDAIRNGAAHAIGENTEGPVVEVLPSLPGTFCASVWPGWEGYLKGDTPFELDDNDLEEECCMGEKIGFVVWLFGPERTDLSKEIYKWLSKSIMPGGVILLASEVPWMGKTLSPSEFAEYTSEEMSASLTRAGFGKIREIVEGPYFRLWTAVRSETPSDSLLMNVENLLSDAKWDEALQLLHSIEDQIGTVQEVREYALLTAACNDLAGKQENCFEALRETLRIDPTCARAMCGLGRLAAITGDLTNAALFFNSAMNHQPFMVAAIRGYGAVCEALGEKELAFESMKAASELRPGDEELLFEVVRIGNLLKKQDETADFLKTRIKMRSSTAMSRRNKVVEDNSEINGRSYLQEA